MSKTSEFPKVVYIYKNDEDDFFMAEERMEDCDLGFNKLKK